MYLSYRLYVTYYSVSVVYHISCAICHMSHIMYDTVLSFAAYIVRLYSILFFYVLFCSNLSYSLFFCSIILYWYIKISTNIVLGSIVFLWYSTATFLTSGRSMVLTVSVRITSSELDFIKVWKGCTRILYRVL